MARQTPSWGRVSARNLERLKGRIPGTTLGGEDRWLTVVSPEDPASTELLLEPSGHPAAKPFKEALVEDGIPLVSFKLDDLDAEFKSLRDRGVRFTTEPVDAGTVRMAVFDDTCGNLIQIVEMTEK